MNVAAQCCSTAPAAPIARRSFGRWLAPLAVAIVASACGPTQAPQPVPPATATATATAVTAPTGGAPPTSAAPAPSPSGSEGGVGAPSGWTIHEFRRQGFAMAVPPGWEVDPSAGGISTVRTQVMSFREPGSLATSDADLEALAADIVDGQGGQPAASGPAILGGLTGLRVDFTAPASSLEGFVIVVRDDLSLLRLWAVFMLPAAEERAIVEGALRTLVILPLCPRPTTSLFLDAALVVETDPGALCLLDAAGARALAGGGFRTRKVSPDGTGIAVFRNRDEGGDGLLVVSAVAGGEATVVDTPPEGANVAAIAWAGDGKRLAYVVDEDVVVIGADGSARLTLDRFDVSDVAWSPVAETLALATVDGAIDVVDLITGATRTIQGDGFDPSWSPDGRRLVFASGDIWVIDADGSGAHPITVEPSVLGPVSPAPGDRCLIDSFTPFTATDPAWAPDGRWIAFARGTSRFVDGNTESLDLLCLVDLDRGDVRLVAQGASRPEWVVQP